MNKKITTLFLYLCLMAVILTGCKTTTQTFTPTNGLHPNYQFNANQYLQKAEQAQSPQREEYTLKAVGYLIKDGSYERAKQLLNSIDESQISTEIKNEKFIIQAYLFNNTSQPQKALSNLSKVTEVEKLSQAKQIFYYDLLARAYQDNNSPLESVSERVKLSQLLGHHTQQEWNTKLIWKTLQHQDIATLDAARIEQSESDYKAWLDLAYLFKQHSQEDSKLHTAIVTWQQQHPDHIANTLLPKKQLQELPVNKSPERIALLLPLSGHYAQPAQAIRDGFMAAYFKELKAGNALSVKLYDTNKKNLKQIYQLALAEGANFIVGPLNKDDVNELSSQQINVPTLALNYLEQQRKPIAKFYQFGISPQDEALQAAIKAYQDGSRNALLIVPQGKWGESIATTFKQEWQALGGSVVGELNYQKKTKINDDIKNLFHITGSYARYRHIQKTIANKTKFIPRRRQDVDMIFLVADAKFARQIRPLLKFYYAGQIPVYSNSSIYSYSMHGNKDIEGIYFCDIPWLLDSEQTKLASQQFAPLTNYRKNRNARLYAMGFDALEVSLRLHQLHTFPEVGIEGATGRLYLDPMGRIRRELLWAEFKDGHLQQVGT